eukprot:SAG11_NODE_3163_length_2641_cov_8.683714_2_plen_59_part_00
MLCEKVGLLDAEKLDVTGAEQARKAAVIDSEPSNNLLARPFQKLNKELHEKHKASTEL